MPRSVAQALKRADDFLAIALDACDATAFIWSSTQSAFPQSNFSGDMTRDCTSDIFDRYQRP